MTASPKPSTSFFVLGIGGAITFYSTAAYFKDTLGEGAFGSLQMAPFVGNLTAMIRLLVVASHNSSWLHGGLVAAGLLYKLCFSTTLFMHVALGTLITALRMHVMVGLRTCKIGCGTRPCRHGFNTITIGGTVQTGTRPTLELV